MRKTNGKATDRPKPPVPVKDDQIKAPKNSRTYKIQKLSEENTNAKRKDNQRVLSHQQQFEDQLKEKQVKVEPNSKLNALNSFKAMHSDRSKRVKSLVSSSPSTSRNKENITKPKSFVTPRSSPVAARPPAQGFWSSASPQPGTPAPPARHPTPVLRYPRPAASPLASFCSPAPPTRHPGFRAPSVQQSRSACPSSSAEVLPSSPTPTQPVSPGAQSHISDTPSTSSRTSESTRRRIFPESNTVDNGTVISKVGIFKLFQDVENENDTNANLTIGSEEGNEAVETEDVPEAREVADREKTSEDEFLRDGAPENIAEAEAEVDKSNKKSGKFQRGRDGKKQERKHDRANVQKRFKNNTVAAKNKLFDNYKNNQLKPNFLCLCFDPTHKTDINNPGKTAGKWICWGDGEAARRFFNEGLIYDPDEHLFCNEDRKKLVVDQKKIIKLSNKPVPEEDSGELTESEETRREETNDMREETGEELLVGPSTSSKKLASTKNHLTTATEDRDSGSGSEKSLQGSHQFGKGSKFSNTKESLDKKKEKTKALKRARAATEFDAIPKKTVQRSKKKQKKNFLDELDEGSE